MAKKFVLFPEIRPRDFREETATQLGREDGHATSERRRPRDFRARPRHSKRPRKFKIRVRRSACSLSTLLRPTTPKTTTTAWTSKHRLLAWKLKKIDYVSLSGEMKSVNVAIINVGIINFFKVAGFESKERLRSSEIKEDGLRFVLRGNEGYLRRDLIYKVINSCFRENLVQIYF